jgi:hypothetical protein
MFGQLTHAIGLNDICDTLRNHSGVLSTIREAVPPSRNGFSHANRNRNADMAEKLFWEVLGYLEALGPGFRMHGRKYCGFPRRFKRVINVIDSTTIKLVANCLDWAKHRRRKAAAKMHLRLDLRSFLPKFVLVKSAGSNDAKEAREVCAGISAGEIAVFDKAYIDFRHLFALMLRGVFWVTRAKDNMLYKVVGQQSVRRECAPLRNYVICRGSHHVRRSSRKYGKPEMGSSKKTESSEGRIFETSHFLEVMG